MVGPLNLYKAPRGTVGGQNNASTLSLPTLVGACITEFGITFGVTFASWCGFWTFRSPMTHHHHGLSLGNLRYLQVRG